MLMFLFVLFWMDVVFVYLLVARHASAVLTVDHRQLLDADRMDGMLENSTSTEYLIE